MTLEQRYLAARAAASVISEGPAMQWHPKTSHGKASDSEPHSQGVALLDQIDQRWEQARTDGERERAVEWAEHAVTRAKRQHTELSQTQRDFWVVEKHVGKDYKRVAEEEGLDARVVWRVRKDAQRNPRDGRQKAA